MSLQEIANSMTVVEDFKPGVNFFDINSTLMNSKAAKGLNKWLIRILDGVDFDMLAGIDARGFLFKSIADQMGKGFTMIRKKGKLPNCTLSDEYATEYSNGEKLSISNQIPPGTRILLADDLVGTGGTILAAASIVSQIGCINVGFLTPVELVNLPKRSPHLDNFKIFSLFKYDRDAKTTHLDPILNEKYLRMERYDSYSMKRYYPLVHHNNDYDTVVMFYPTMQEIAENYVSKTKRSRLGTIIWDKFNDGTDNIKFENEEYLRDKKVIFFMSLIDGDIFTQISMMKVLPRQDITSLHVYLPFFPVGTMERVGEYGPNVLATADTLSSMISTDVPMTKTGPVKLTIYDLHTLQNRFYFNNDIMIEMATGVELLKKFITKDTLIVFPDAGAKSRFGEFFPKSDGYHVVACSKVRRGDERIITCDDIDDLPRKINFTKAIIIDDLVQSGGTLFECKKALRRKGISNVSAYVTHLVLPNNAHLRFINDSDFTYIYHTNSNPTVVKRIKDDCIRLGKRNPFHCIHFEEHLGKDTYKELYPGQRSFVNIAVSSSSESKLSAVYESFSKIFNCRVYGVSGIKSLVPDQPIGIEETEIGCNNRSDELNLFIKDRCGKEFKFQVSIENGIRTNGIECYDFACVRIMSIDNDNNFITRMSEMVEFPKEYYDESLSNGKTVGHLLNRDYGYDSTSWHHHFSSKTRNKIISETTELILDEHGYSF